MTIGPDKRSPGHDLLGEVLIHGLAQRLVTAPELEPFRPACLPGPQLVVRVGRKEKVTILGREDEAGTLRVVVDAGYPDHDETNLRPGKRCREPRERLQAGQFSRATRAKYSRNSRCAVS